MPAKRRKDVDQIQAVSTSDSATEYALNQMRSIKADIGRKPCYQTRRDNGITTLSKFSDFSAGLRNHSG